jgi:hypothetical protein
VIDGRIRSAKRTEPLDEPDSMLDPDAIALGREILVQRIAAPLDDDKRNVRFWHKADITLAAWDVRFRW